MSTDKAVIGKDLRHAFDDHSSKGRGFYFKFKKPSSSEGLVFGFWYRVVLIFVSVLPAWGALTLLGALNDYAFEPWMLAVAAALAVTPLLVGEILRRTVYEQTVRIEAEVVEIRVTGSGLRLTSEDHENLEQFKVNYFKERNSYYRMYGKRALDTLLILIALPALLPMMLVVAAFIWMDGHTPFYRVARVGYKGKVFHAIKFRTLSPRADELLLDLLSKDPQAREEWSTTQRLKNDPRITRIGLFLRKTGLDELPQLLNVAMGHMSLVGPVPILPEQAALYSQTSYFAMKPGLTGLWQISLRNDVSFAARSEYDEAYYKGMSLSADVSIIINTFRAVRREMSR